MTDKTPPEDPFDAAVTEERLVPLPAGGPDSKTLPRGHKPLPAPIERTPDPPLSDPYAAKPAKKTPKRAEKVEPAADKPASRGPNEPPVESLSAPRPRRWLKPVLLVGAVGLSVVGFGLTYVALNFDNLVQGSVKNKAKERGFGIRAGEVKSQGLLPWQKGKPGITVTDVKLVGEEHPELEVEADSVVIDLGGRFPSYEPKSIKVENAYINSPDIPSLIALEKSAKSGTLSKTPFKLTNARLRVASISKAVPVTVVGRATEISGDRGAIRFSDVTLELPIPFVDLKLGPASADVTRADGKTTVVFDSLKQASFSLDDAAKTATVDLTPMASGEIDKLLGTDLPEMKVSGNASVDVSQEAGPSGTFAGVLDGYVPPHPRELNGIVFGGKTKVNGNFHIEDKTIKLDSLALEAGSFKLAGTGNVTLVNGGFMTLEMKGSVPCADLASSAIGSHLGATAGLISGALASGRLTGSVSVTVKVEAKLTDIEHAKVIPSAFVGCKVSIGF